MAGRVSPLVRALGFALLSIGGCRGTDHRLFLEIDKTVVETPAPRRDASVPPHMAEAGTAGGGNPPEPPMTLDAGPPGRDPNLDESVKFPWTETLPGKGTCRAGLYIGRFSCTAGGDAGIIESLVVPTGQVVFTLDGTDEDPTLTVTDGRLTDDLFPGFLTDATLTGKLDCPNMQRFEAWATGGPVLKTNQTLLTGWLNTDTLVIKGGFSISIESGTTWSCRFEANAAP